MKILISFIISVFINSVFADEAQLGIILGSTSGLSAKYDLGQDRAVDGALSYSIEGKYGLSLHSDYLFNRARQFSLGELSPLFMYYGLGVRLLNIRTGTDEGNTRVGIRGPIGTLYRTNYPSLEFFGELVPILDIAPRSDLFIDLGLGVRVIF